MRSALAGIVRLLGFLALWLVLDGPRLVGLPVGIFTAGLATWTSFRLLPPGRNRPRFTILALLAVRFVWQSTVAGVDVARRALDPRLPLRPGFVEYPVHLPPSLARSAFLTLSSLLPGTLPAGSDEDGVVLIHCLDVEQPVLAQMTAEEVLLTRALGGEGNGGKRLRD